MRLIELLKLKFPKKESKSEPERNPKEIHEHQWELILKNYFLPRKDVSTFISGNLKETTVEKAIFGATVLLWKCLDCSETKKEEVLGNDENHLENLLKKAEEFGPQYIQIENTTFIIAKWNPPTTPINENVLPLR